MSAVCVLSVWGWGMFHRAKSFFSNRKDADFLKRPDRAKKGLSALSDVRCLDEKRTTDSSVYLTAV